MNKAHKELLEKRYVEAVNEYVQAFCDKHGYERPECWVGDRVGEILEVNDMFVDFRNIKIDIDNSVPEEVFEQWYNYTLRLGELGCEKTISYWSFALGAPLPYSEAQLKAIEVAKTRRDEAEQSLKDCLGAMSDTMDFMSSDEVCGNCKNGEIQPDGSYCRCDRRDTLQKYLDPACGLYEKGGSR
jgi:hypothetical protein